MNKNYLFILELMLLGVTLHLGDKRFGVRCGGGGDDINECCCEENYW